MFKRREGTCSSLGTRPGRAADDLAAWDRYTPMNEPLLHNKSTIIYGAGGGIGSGVALEFARQGARLFLAGRTREPLERVADQVTALGAGAEVAVVDALDEEAVERHADSVVAAAGGIDVSINVISRGDVQGTPLIEMSSRGPDGSGGRRAADQLPHRARRGAAHGAPGLRGDPHRHQRVKPRGAATDGRHRAGGRGRRVDAALPRRRDRSCGRPRAGAVDRRRARDLRAGARHQRGAPRPGPEPASRSRP